MSDFAGSSRAGIQAGQLVRPEEARPDSLARAERLRVAVNAAGKNKAVAARSGVPSSTLDVYLRGSSGMKIDALIALAEATNVNLEWLATGRGPMRPGEKSTATEVWDALAHPGYIDVPRYDVRAGAGRGVVSPEEQLAGQVLLPEAYVRDFLRRRPQDLALITAVGQSMAPTILDGDQVMIDTSVRELRNSGLYVLRVDEEIMVKRLQRMITGEIRVISDNPAYGEERITPSDAVPLHILGEVIYRAGRVSP